MAVAVAVNPPEGFSSHGPTLSGQNKPEIAGPNGLTTSVYGPANFYGTSASTPATAAAIAVWMSADPRLSAREAAADLVASARTDRAVGARADSGLGAGRLRLPPPGGEPRGCGGALGALLLLPALGLGRRRR